LSAPAPYSGGPRLAGFLRRVEVLLGLIAALILLALMLVTCVDVVGRYAFDRPIPGGFEITELAMGALIFTSLPLVTLRRQQVTVDLFDSLVPSRYRRLQRSFLDLIAAACMGGIAWRIWIKAVEIGAAGETTASLMIPIYPLVYYMFFLTSITTALIVLLACLDRAGADESNPVYS